MLDTSLEKCPYCERNFHGVEDFPLIYLKSFERIEISKDLVFPFEDSEIFVGITSHTGNKKAPVEVIRFFEDNLNEEKFVYEGWEWRIQKRGYEDSYNRVQVDQKEIILEKINPYLDKLETLVGKEVCLKEFLPNFKKDNYFKFAFNIPDTKYCFSFNEYENVGEYRTTGIKILGDGMNLGSAGGPTLTDLCEVGRLTYEGRLRPI